MVKPAKLYALLLQSTNRTVSFRDFERLLRAFGFEWARTTGSHRQYVHPKVPRAFPVQPEAKDAKRYQIRELLELVETLWPIYRRVNEPHYHINLFWSGEDECWIADVPDLRPCSAHGDTRQQAVSNIRDAIEGWLEVAREKGFPIPEPRYRPAIYAAR